MTYTASHAANFMLDRAKDEGRPLSPLKLIKLVYIAYGWQLSLTGKRLFDEKIYAWKHGPVIKSVYDEFKHFGGQCIDGHAVEFDLEKEKFVTPRIPSSDDDATMIASTVWDIHKKYSAWQLRQMTHEPDTPWAKVYREGISNIEIPDDLINEYFDKKIAAYLNAASR